jgi:phage shock protein PspC (stress-responsive transcriptional regulator)
VGPIPAPTALCDHRDVDTTRTTSPSPTARPAPTPVLVRSRSDRVLAGVAGGLATRIGVEPVLVRLAFALLALAAGTGLVAYALLWALLPERDVAPPRLGDQARTEHAVAVGLITLGLVLLAQALLPWLFFERLVWPATLAAVGLGVTWEPPARRSAPAGAASPPASPPTRWPSSPTAAPWSSGPPSASSSSWSASGRSSSSADRSTHWARWAITMVVTAAGVALLLGPWIARLVRQLGVERRERIRSEERAEVAAHLHDSVLQTLTLIQRTAGSPHETVSLARRQERELRAWLL